MFDYEAVKRFYFEKGHADSSGKGRFESAFFHTIEMVHDTVREQTLAESASHIEALQADIKTLCAALKTSGEGNARLLAEVAMLRTGDTCGRQCEGTAYRVELQRLRGAVLAAGGETTCRSEMDSEVAAAAKAIIDYADGKGWALAVAERKPGDTDGELSKRLRLALSKASNATSERGE